MGSNLDARLHLKNAEESLQRLSRELNGGKSWRHNRKG